MRLGSKSNQHGDGVSKAERVYFDWIQLDIIMGFKNSDLTSVGSLTHSSTLGVIYGLKIHGRGMAEVLKNPTQSFGVCL